MDWAEILLESEHLRKLWAANDSAVGARAGVSPKGVFPRMSLAYNVNLSRMIRKAFQ